MKLSGRDSEGGVGLKTLPLQADGEGMRILMLVGVLLLGQACVVVPVRHLPGSPPPPPPPSSRAMNYDEAVGLGLQFSSVTQGDRLKMNVIAACVDTATAKVAKNKP
jgi:hypothetical protein